MEIFNKRSPLFSSDEVHAKVTSDATDDLADRRTVVQRRGMVKCSYTLPVRQIYSELLTLIDLARVIYWPEHACERVRLLRRPTGANGMETAAEFAEYNIRILRCAGKYVSRT